MKTMFKTTFPVLLMLTLSCGLAFGQAAERATAATDARTATLSHAAPSAAVTTVFTDAIKATIKTPAGQSDLLVTFSAITALIARSTNADQSATLVVTSNTAESVAIRVRLLVDGIVVPFAALPSPPGPINVVPLDNLVKTTTLFIAPVGVTDALTQAFTLGGVRSVTWAVPSVGNGEHTIEVQFQFALADVFATIPAGQPREASSTTAILGPRTLTVQGVNIKTN